MSAWKPTSDSLNSIDGAGATLLSARCDEVRTIRLMSGLRQLGVLPVAPPKVEVSAAAYLQFGETEVLLRGRSRRSCHRCWLACAEELDKTRFYKAR